MFRRLKEFLVGVMVVGGLMVGGKVSALTYSSDVGVRFTFNSSLQVNVSADLIISNLSPGTDSDSNIIDVVVKTNNATGYTLNATVGNNTTYNTRNLVHEVSGSSANFASINFGSSLSALSTDNTWGYSYSTNNGSTWSNYDGLPLYSDATNIATLKTATGPASTNAGDKVNFKIAAKAATSQYSGEYNNVINFVATANPVPTLGPVACASGKICYNDNSLDEAIGTMGQQTASANSSITLLASNFSREGYGFAGWSDAYDYATNQNAHFYGPHETIVTPVNMDAGLSLYAVWIYSAGSIQSDASDACNSLIAAPIDGTANLASVSALTDERDNNTYAIAKLADGKCWMIENLRLENTAAHNSDGSLAQGYGASAIYGNFSGLANPESTDFIDSTTANSLYYSYSQTGTASIFIGTNNYAGQRMPRYNNWNNQATSTNRPQNPTTNSATNSTTNAGMYSYGNYYTWSAATANTIYYSNYSQSEEANTSICPTGWMLPYARSNGRGNAPGGFYYLNYKVNNNSNGTDAVASNKLRAFPNNIVLSGVFLDSSTNLLGNYGFYRSSTIDGNATSSVPYIQESAVLSEGDVISGSIGASIRCVIGP